MFQEKELLQLIYTHLQAKGLREAASALQKEASLPRCATPPNVYPALPQVYSSPHTATTPKTVSYPPHPCKAKAFLEPTPLLQTPFA